MSYSIVPLSSYRRWPTSAGILMGLLELGWSDNRIASYFCIEPDKVSGLRGYFGLVQQAHDSWVWRLRQQSA